MTTYRIVRFFQKREPHREVIKTGLIFEEVDKHCNDPETSSRTCTSEEGIERTAQHGPWFDGYEEE